MNRIAIVSAYRSAIGSFGGSLKDIPIADLGAQVLTATLERKGIPKTEIDEVIIGNVLGAGQGQNIARQIALGSGLSETTSAFTINKVCGSGLKAVQLAAQSILAGDHNVVVAGGIEIMSQAPYLAKNHRFGQKLGHSNLVDSLLSDGLTDAFSQEHMGMTAENVADKFQISREEQDQFALESQTKALAAIEAGRFSDEIIPITIQQGRKEFLFDQDEYPRQTSLEKLSALRPAFKQDGSVTAGNASGINDGCAFVVLMSEQKAIDLNVEPMAYIESSATSGLDPAYMGLGPIAASQKALSKIDKTIADIDLFEINEAFAAQALPVLAELGIDKENVNVNGGAIALGHPIGASGTRILVTLLYELTKRNAHLGLCSLCIGGGQGISMIVSNAQKG